MTTNRSLEKRLESFDLFDSFELFDPKHNFADLSLFVSSCKGKQSVYPRFYEPRYCELIAYSVVHIKCANLAFEKFFKI